MRPGGRGPPVTDQEPRAQGVPRPPAGSPDAAHGLGKRRASQELALCFAFSAKQTPLARPSAHPRTSAVGALTPHGNPRGWGRWETGHREGAHSPTAAQPGGGSEPPRPLWGKASAWMTSGPGGLDLPCALGQEPLLLVSGPPGFVRRQSQSPPTIAGISPRGRGLRTLHSGIGGWAVRAGPQHGPT